jgi:predicted ABC-type ATPase
MRRLDLIVGPNGAGKSTIVDLVLARRIPGSVVVNADLIAARRCRRIRPVTRTRPPRSLRRRDRH